MKDTKGNGKPPKKPYARPLLKQVNLRPEEAVLGNCKAAGLSGPVGVGACAPTGTCNVQGS
jgi:hypothetical protein